MTRNIARVDRAAAASVLVADARKYVMLALRLGASAARTIKGTDVIVDDRVQFKCQVPKCFGYGTCGNCPPYAPSAADTRKLAAQYQMAVVVRLDVPPPVIVRDRATIEERVAAYRKSNELVCALESAAFYDGHYLSVGFGAGSCKSTYCHDKPCAVLAGEKCRHNLKARPSMEAVGIDCFALADLVGWEIYPVGSSATAEEVPAASLMGIVFVG